jgi:hypothetical protein
MRQGTQPVAIAWRAAGVNRLFDSPMRLHAPLAVSARRVNLALYFSCR